ncbi:MAG: ATPase, T2SS/T4P/T4SS family [Thermodesulfovibrionales bacterium]|nr:ATPase, T2SS/T4P/T4SS family [Thermodesulfovibrionales bacterium]
MKEKEKGSLLDILSAEGLLTEEQAKLVRTRETLQRSKILKSKAPGIRHAIVDQSIISLIDVIESLKITSPGAEGKLLTADVIMMTVARHLNLPFVRIDPLKLDYETVTRIISRPYAIRHQIVPIALTNTTLTVATADPFDKEAVDWIERVSGYKVDIVVATKEDIMKIITEFFGFKSAITSADKEIDTRTDLGNLEQYIKLKSITELEATDQHIVNAVEYLLHYAYSSRASDIHIEPKREFSLVRFRIDGILHNIHKIPKAVHPPIISRIKMLARMDIAEKRRPQDGRIKTGYEGKEVELRISTLPVAFGEKVVIRIFDPVLLMKDIEALGFFPKELELVKSFITNTHGIILATGPTGSGKTTTLYSLLKLLSTSEVNVTTIEDPIEMIYEGFNQTAVHPQIDVTFASSLRTILRQDPDIIMVGEIRDIETAENAIQAALTGHLVFSTLHTNDAPSSITRLIDIGAKDFLLNATLLGVIAQRLVRKVCPSCKEEYRLTKDECYILRLDYEKVKQYTVSLGRGCEECRGTGYMGRTGIFEIMDMTEKIREEIHEKTSLLSLKKVALGQGMRTLKENAIKKLIQGVTTVDEVVRVTGLT